VDGELSTMRGIATFFLKKEDRKRLMSARSDGRKFSLLNSSGRGDPENTGSSLGKSNPRAAPSMDSEIAKPAICCQRLERQKSAVMAFKEEVSTDPPPFGISSGRGGSKISGGIESEIKYRGGFLKHFEEVFKASTRNGMPQDVYSNKKSIQDSVIVHPPQQFRKKIRPLCKCSNKTDKTQTPEVEGTAAEYYYKKSNLNVLSCPVHIQKNLKIETCEDFETLQKQHSERFRRRELADRDRFSAFMLVPPKGFFGKDISKELDVSIDD